MPKDRPSGFGLSPLEGSNKYQLAGKIVSYDVGLAEEDSRSGNVSINGHTKSPVYGNMVLRTEPGALCPSQGPQELWAIILVQPIGVA
eukprot:scaffold8467_cov59-Attheya_sp.AAC.5